MSKRDVVTLTNVFISVAFDETLVGAADEEDDGDKDEL